MSEGQPVRDYVYLLNFLKSEQTRLAKEIANFEGALLRLKTEQELVENVLDSRLGDLAEYKLQRP